MTTQQMLIAETVSSLRKALKRKAYADSDSDSSVDHVGNRGIKLKKRARFARLGQLVAASGPEAYRQMIEYDGVKREIISRKPPLVDEDGYEIDSDDDDERIDEATLAAVEFDPYANVNLEQIFAPLAAITDLPTHPSMARPFTSKMLTQLADESSHIMRKENQTLWKTKRMMTALSGDYFWAPCGLMQMPADVDVYSDDFLPQHLLTVSIQKESSSKAEASDESSQTANGDCKPSDPEDLGSNAVTTNGTDQADSNGDVPMPDASRNPREEDKEEDTELETEMEPTKSPMNGDKAQGGSADKKRDIYEARKPIRENINGESLKRGVPFDDNTSNSHLGPDTILGTEETGLISDRPPTPSLIHPLFAPPPNARPDRNIGLAAQEADELRGLLSLYIQKQEEVCRGMARLNEGLLRADRMRKEVFRWSKAEAHCGPNRDMSDGEDWYDLEEWGLDADLKKGQDDEEEDSGTTAKKTRARR